MYVDYDIMDIAELVAEGLTFKNKYVMISKVRLDITLDVDLFWGDGYTSLPYEYLELRGKLILI